MSRTHRTRGVDGRQVFGFFPVFPVASRDDDAVVVNVVPLLCAGWQPGPQQAGREGRPFYGSHDDTSLQPLGEQGDLARALGAQALDQFVHERVPVPCC